MIQEQREDIITNNNTAQTQLNGILENANKSYDTINIEEHLYGDLDFSNLSNNGFGNVRAIYLSKGSITNVINLPEGLEIFDCPSNLLISLDNLPSSLKQLILNDNYLTTIDLTQTPNLEKLIVSNNKFNKIENLPETLTEFYCESNKLQRLNLLGLSKLRVLYISDNTITIIENMPKGVVDFQMKNTPSIEFREIDIDTNIKPAYKREYTDVQRMNFTDSLNEYFRIKNNYEDALHKMKKRIHDNAPSRSVAKKKVREIKPQCIKCKRPVGTCFSKKENRYMAICGDTKNPCKLDIQLFMGSSNPRTWILYAYKDADDTNKDEIIIHKMNSLFGYTSDEISAKEFENALKQYNTNNKLYKELLIEHNEIYNNTHKKELIIEKMENIFRLNEQIRILLDEFKQTANREVLKTAMNLQVNELLPETRNVRMLKYKIMEIEQRELKSKEIEHTLIQHPFSFSELDNEYGEPPRVIAFNI
jgi:hypothetical protein